VKIIRAVENNKFTVSQLYYSNDENGQTVSQDEKSEIDKCLENLADENRKKENPGITKVKAFGINIPRNDGVYWTGYYIGLDWLRLDEKHTYPLSVSPKIDNLDYEKMFAECLKHPETRKEVANIYDIRINEKPIEPPESGKSDFMFLIILHYLKLLHDLLKKPLMKAYVTREENLKSKIKGKVLISGQIKKNIANRRIDRMMCRFDEFSTDCFANRLLHSALQICSNYITAQKDALKGHDLSSLSPSSFSNMENKFNGIGYINNAMEIQKIKTNPLYHEYKDALSLAKLIYQYYSYNEKNAGSKKYRFVYPYIINMPILFELYVYTKLLKTGHSIKYQPAGSKSERPDFINTSENSKMIIDTKYKEKYANDYDMDDIRQLSGYARDTKILKLLGDAKGQQDNPAWDTVLDCLIIYPDKDNGSEEIPQDFNREMKNHKIVDFHKFYKFGIKLPETGNNTGAL
jgi:hypothetical protein